MEMYLGKKEYFEFLKSNLLLTQSRAEQIIENNRELMGNILSESGFTVPEGWDQLSGKAILKKLANLVRSPSGELSKKYLELIIFIDSLAKKARDDKDFEHFHKLKHLTYIMWFLVVMTEPKIHHFLENEPWAMSKSFDLGWLSRALFSHIPEELTFELHAQYFHRIVSSNGQKSRWAERNELYEQALAFANNSWEEGDELWHHKMVEKIMEMDTFKELSKATLLKRIKPLAQKHGRFWDPGKQKAQQTE